MQILRDGALAGGFGIMGWLTERVCVAYWKNNPAALKRLVPATKKNYLNNQAFPGKTAQLTLLP